MKFTKIPEFLFAVVSIETRWAVIVLPEQSELAYPSSSGNTGSAFGMEDVVVNSWVVQIT